MLHSLFCRQTARIPLPEIGFLHCYAHIVSARTGRIRSPRDLLPGINSIPQSIFAVRVHFSPLLHLGILADHLQSARLDIVSNAPS